MRILLVHQNFPGQFKHLFPALLENPANEVVVFTMKDFKPTSRCRVVRYRHAKGTAADIHPWLQDIETQVIRGEAAYRAAIELRGTGFEPDVILAHPGWGESLFLKEVWPYSRLIIYCEFFYSVKGSDVGFDTEFPPKDIGDACRVRLKNLNNLLHFQSADAGISPTEWQKSTFPEPFRSKIRVIHDGIDTDVIRPSADAWLQIGAIRLTRSDEVITFVNRNLEPYRGYHTFMRALPLIQRARPNARILIVGGDGVSYGAKAPKGLTWKDIFLDEVKDRLDMSRIHFLGHVEYKFFIPLLQISTVHVYLTYPFVLSWSLLEAMSCGCAIVASDTAPLREAISDGHTGLLTDFFNAEQLAERVSALSANEALRLELGSAARKFAVTNYDLKKVCLPATIEMIEDVSRKV